MSAAARAAHPLVDDGPPLLVDEQAPLLCAAAGSPGPLDYQRAAPREPVLAAARFSAVVRSRFAEDRVRAARTAQVVVLGAGLDTAAHRLGPDRTVWLVDLPGVLAWRAGMLAAAGIREVGRPVGADLAGDGLADALVAAGFDPGRPAAVVWLGTTMYLPSEAVRRVLDRPGLWAPGSHVVLDHVLPPGERDDAGRAYAAALAAVAGGSGEPWRSSATADEVAALLGAAGWQVVEAVDEGDAVPSGFWPDRGAARPDGLRRQRLVRLVHAER